MVRSWLTYKMLRMAEDLPRNSLVFPLETNINVKESAAQKP